MVFILLPGLSWSNNDIFVYGSVAVIWLQDIEPLLAFVLMGGLIRLKFNLMCVNLCYFLYIKWSGEIQGSSGS